MIDKQTLIHAIKTLNALLRRGEGLLNLNVKQAWNSPETLQTHSANIHNVKTQISHEMKVLEMDDVNKYTDLAEDTASARQRAEESLPTLATRKTALDSRVAELEGIIAGNRATFKTNPEPFKIQPATTYQRIKQAIANQTTWSLGKFGSRYAVNKRVVPQGVYQLHRARDEAEIKSILVRKLKTPRFARLTHFFRKITGRSRSPETTAFYQACNKIVNRK